MRVSRTPPVHFVYYACGFVHHRSQPGPYNAGLGYTRGVAMHAISDDRQGSLNKEGRAF